MTHIILLAVALGLSIPWRPTAIAQEREPKERDAEIVSLEKEKTAAEKALTEAEEMLSGDERAYRIATAEKRLERAKKALKAAKQARELIARLTPPCVNPAGERNDPAL